MLRKNLRTLLRPLTTGLIARPHLGPNQIRFFSVTADPSVEALEAFLLKGQGGTTLSVSEIVSDEIVRFPTIDGVALGNVVTISTNTSAVKGVIIHFDRKFATVAVLGGSAANITRGADISLTAEMVPLSVPRVKFALDSVHVASKPLRTNVPVIDMLLPGFVKQGMTVGIYSHNFSVAAKLISDNTVLFPSRVHQSGIDMYLDLIAQTRRVLSTQKDSTFFADLRHFEPAYKSLEFQSGQLLPVSAESLVASVLQLSHSDNRRSVSVIAVMNSPSDFGNEAARSVDIPIDLAGDGSISNLKSLLTRFGLKKFPSTPRELLIHHLVEGFRKSVELDEKKSLNVFIDDFERDEQESFNTCLRLLPFAGEAFAKATDIEQMVLLRALTVLFFNKTAKRNSSAVAKFADELLNTFRLEEDHLLQWATERINQSPHDTIMAIDEAIIRHRLRLEVSNPLSI